METIDKRRKLKRRKLKSIIYLTEQYPLEPLIKQSYKKGDIIQYRYSISVEEPSWLTFRKKYTVVEHYKSSILMIDNSGQLNGYADYAFYFKKVDFLYRKEKLIKLNGIY